MTQPVDGFTTQDLCGGYWLPSDPRRVLSRRAAAQKALEDTIEMPPLPQREPGKYADIPEWT